jgi:Tfp pilus assembly protein PilZ
MGQEGSHSKDRRYIRHPARMPIRFSLPGDTVEREDRLRNVGEGGLCFLTASPLESGQRILLRVPVLGRSFEIDGQVVWCRSAGDGYEVGVGFATRQASFCVRMVEQLCHIEDYRARVAREEGRELSSDQAAQEWIRRFAGDFPGLS